MAQHPTHIFDIHNLMFHRLNARELRTIMTSFEKTISTQRNFDDRHIWRKRRARHTGCSKNSSSKAAASKEARRTLRYVEPLSDARTPLAGFFSILLEQRLLLPQPFDLTHQLLYAILQTSIVEPKQV
jgi:hypothetical protein